MVRRNSPVSLPYGGNIGLFCVFGTVTASGKSCLTSNLPQSQILSQQTERGLKSIGKRKTKDESVRRLYDKLLQASEIPIIETSDIHSKGFYLTESDRKDTDAEYEAKVKKTIYIKESLSIREKLKVLLHEYSHHIHLTHYYKQENRAECEIIANGSGFLVSAEFGLNILRDVDLTKFTDDTDIAARLRVAIQNVGGHIIVGISKAE